MEVGSILAALPVSLPAAVGLDGSSVVVACGAEEVVAIDGPETFSRLDRLGPGWWAGFLSYDLGRSVEHVTPPAPVIRRTSVPDALFIRFAASAVLDRRNGRCMRLMGKGPGRRYLEDALDSPRVAPRVALGPWSTSLARPEFEAGVRTIVEHIEAGDCYQVNLTRRLTCDREADPVAPVERARDRQPGAARIVPAHRRRRRHRPLRGLRIARALPARRRAPGRDAPRSRAPRSRRPGCGRARRTGPRT